jgi:hypothetical protein
VTGVLVLRGPNFSGRSAWLAARRKERRWPETVLIGPYPETALTGLAWRVGEEIALASGDRERRDGLVARLGLAALLDREIHVLSGGEMVRIALAAMLAGEASELQIDVALEQLDAGWRDTVVTLLQERAATATVALADNRLEPSECGKPTRSWIFPLDRRRPPRSAQSRWTARTGPITSRAATFASTGCRSGTGALSPMC